jgi:hypothetical protein
MIPFIDRQIHPFCSALISQREKFSFHISMECVMSQSQFESENEMSEIIPDDSMSRGQISNPSVESQDSNIFAAATSVRKTSNTANPGPWDQSNLVFVKDDKYESNVEYLDGLLGVFTCYYKVNRRKSSTGLQKRGEIRTE